MCLLVTSFPADFSVLSSPYFSLALILSIAFLPYCWIFYGVPLFFFFINRVLGCLLLNTSRSSLPPSLSFSPPFCYSDLLRIFIYLLGHLCAGHLLDLSSTARLAEMVSAEPVVMPWQALHTSQAACFAHPSIAGAGLFPGAVRGSLFHMGGMCPLQNSIWSHRWCCDSRSQKNSAAIAAVLDAWPLLKHGNELLLFHPELSAGTLVMVSQSASSDGTTVPVLLYINSKNRKSWYTT